MKTGPATITLKDGRTYVAEQAALTSRRLMFTGRLRVTSLAGTRLYPPSEHSVTPGAVKSIAWGER